MLNRWHTRWPGIALRIAGLVLTLSGCATTNQLTLANFVADPDDKLPAITVFFKRPSEDFRRQCQLFDQQSLLHHCTINSIDLALLQQQFQQTGAFEDVSFADDEVDYRVLVTTGLYNLEGGDDLGSALVAGATLLMAPMITSMNIKVEASVSWFGQELERFHYDIPFEQRVSLFSTQQDTAGDMARSVVSHIVHDLQAEAVFTPRFLADRLQSSHYDIDRQFPQASGDYALYAGHIYTHPFQGVQVRYLHTLNTGDYIDVFIYPIRSVLDDHDADTLLRRESTNIHQDIEQAVAGQNFSDLSFTEDKSLLWNIGNHPTDIIRFQHEYTDAVINTFTSTTYIAMVEDKFVTLRHTTLKGTLSDQQTDSLSQSLLEAISVPPESLFMSRVRTHWRDNNTL